MEFKEPKGIFQQIADSICDKILSGELKAGDKLDSVRELAAKIGVNQNTIMRTYTEMMRDRIIDNQRGIGFFVNPNAKEQILEKRREEFFSDELPFVAKQMRLLNITTDELVKRINDEG
ncbi:MAG: GntR family transcriptional regulator [Bacteroidales bacterium]|nr:GntR family transcriptional regulator [Bacteroidales bacterium]